MSDFETRLPGKYQHATTGTVYTRVTERNGIYTVTNMAGAQYSVNKEKLIPIPIHTPVMPSNDVHSEELRRIKAYEARKKHRDKKYFGGNREKTIIRDGEKCVECGITRQQHMEKYGHDITVDHIDNMGTTVLAENRNNSMDNLQTMCLYCHAIKDGKRRLTDIQVINILHCKGSINGVKLSALYNINTTAIYDIWGGVTWKHLTASNH